MYRRLLILLLFSSCGEDKKNLPVRDTTGSPAVYSSGKNDTSLIVGPAIGQDTCMLEKQLIAAGLVNIGAMDSSIRVELRYSSTNNFLGLDVYGDLEHCYLQKEVADKLLLAQRKLKQKNAGYSLLVYDGVRPVHIQQLMWDTISVDPKDRGRYVSNPAKGSLHNYGAAVDLTICDENGKPLDMGTDFDFFGELAYPAKEKEMADSGKLDHYQIQNRALLREVMYSAGFFGIQTEWWHFNSCRRDSAAKWYPIIQ